MLVSTDWIRDFVDLPQLEGSELGSRFTLATAEVEEVIEEGAHLDKILVAEIQQIEKHPDADKLNLVTFTFGKSTARVVCGAPNVKVGLKVPYAPVYTTLPGGFTLEPKKIRGVLSEGMLCSESELGISEESSGLMELPADTKIGMTFGEYIGAKKDVILDIDNKSLTHRPDLWGHFGLAREFAAAFDSNLTDRFSKEWEEGLLSKLSGGKSPMSIQVSKESSCLGYFGLSVDGVEVKDSPQWIKNRLIAVGLRPINNIVDISNYVMLELGIPLHIFDRKKIKGDKVVIELLGKEDNFVTLDEEERKLLTTDTIIKDAEKPLVLAGIMGGLNSGVEDNTKSIFIEVANWKAAEVRKTSTRLGLRTDSSQRYEKTLDSQLLKRTLLRTLELILELCPEAKVIGQLEYDGPNLNDYKHLVINASTASVNSQLGIELEESKIVGILTSLGFGVVSKAGKLEVTVPSYRATKDVEVEADLVEEVGRMIGYDNIRPTSPHLEVFPVRLTRAQKLNRTLRDFLVNHAKAFEVMTYAMIGEGLIKKAGLDKSLDSLVLLNPLSKDHDRMRPSLIPGLLDAASKNAKNFDEFRFFELGKSYLPANKDFREEKSQVAIVFFSKNSNENIFTELLDTVDKTLKIAQVPFDFVEPTPKFVSPVVPADWEGRHPHEFLDVRIMGRVQGSVFTVHPLLARGFKVKGTLSIAIIDLTQVEKQKVKSKFKYQPLPKYPSSTFDCTVVADSGTPVGDILSVGKKIKLKELKSLKVLDIFKQEDGKNAVTLRSIFHDPDQTLSGDFLHQAQDTIVKELGSAGFLLKE